MSDQLDRAIADMRYLEAGGQWEARSYSVNPRGHDDQLRANEQIVTIVLRRKDVKP